MFPSEVFLGFWTLTVAASFHQTLAVATTPSSIGYCPCNFNFSVPEDDLTATDPSNKDLSCYGSVPLIAGIKNIEEDDTLKEQLRKQNFTLNKVLEYACAYYGAYAVTFTDENAAIQKYKEMGETRLDLFQTLFFISYSSSEDDERVSTAKPYHLLQCGFFWDKFSTLVKGTCDDIVKDNRRIVRGLCMSPPIDKDTEMDQANAGGCYCPCTFFADDAYRCTRDVVRCIPVNNTDDMIATCSTAGAAPAVVARAKDSSSVPAHWIADALFFIGDSTNNFTVDDSVGCGYNASQEDGTFEIRSSEDYAGNISCNQFLEELLIEKEDDPIRFFAVLCTTTLVNNTVRGDCGKYVEDELELDEPECGTVALFDRNVQRALIIWVMIISCILS